MASYTIGLIWRRVTPDFDIKTFNRDHLWLLAGGQWVQGSAAPEYAGNADMSNPEEALLAALASCHMLTFLSIAALQRLMVNRYEDEPIAELGKNEKGKMRVARITLRPKADFGEDRIVCSETLRDLHRKAKENCFIGNSLSSEIILEPR